MELCRFHYPELTIVAPPTNRAGRRERASKTFRKVRRALEKQYGEYERELSRIRRATAPMEAVVFVSLALVASIPLAAYVAL